LTFELRGQVQVRDHALWISHIAGADELARWLEAIPAGGDVDLIVDGVRGAWRKMADGKDGRSSQGLLPVLPNSKRHWHGLQQDRGRFVTIGVRSDF
jgi:hypothetical protein